MRSCGLPLDVLMRSESTMISCVLVHIFRCLCCFLFILPRCSGVRLVVMYVCQVAWSCIGVVLVVVILLPLHGEVSVMRSCDYRCPVSRVVTVT